MSRVYVSTLALLLVSALSPVSHPALRTFVDGSNVDAVRSPAQQPAIKFEPTEGVPTFAVRPPVLRLKPGAVVETRTFSKAGDYYDEKRAARGPVRSARSTSKVQRRTTPLSSRSCACVRIATSPSRP